MYDGRYTKKRDFLANEFEIDLLRSPMFVSTTIGHLNRKVDVIDVVLTRSHLKMTPRCLRRNFPRIISEWLTFEG